MFIPSYIFKLEITLVVVFIAYWLFFRKLTFHAWNRWYLLVFSMLSFIIPLIELRSFFTSEGAHSIVHFIPSVESVIVPINGSGSLISNSQIYLLMAAGSLIFFTRLLIQLFSFVRLKRSADVVVDGPVKIYQVHKRIMPFSFANSIFIHAAQHDDVELQEIIRHEFIHVKQRHTIDVMVAELLVMFNWYNPFAWLLRYSIRQNLEFIADEKVVQSGLDRKQYQYLLLKVVGVSDLSITSKFNFQSLKKRIDMMNRNKSAKVQLLRFGVIVPIVLLALVAFRGQQRPTEQAPAMVSNRDTVPVKPEVEPDKIAAININGNQVGIVLKDGSSESYDLNVPSEKAKFEKRYGKVKTPFPAPQQGIQVPNDISEMNVIKRNGEQRVEIRKNDGTMEKYNLLNAEEKVAFENKYGKIPPPPPPPPAPGAPVSPHAPGAPLSPAPPPPPPMPDDVVKMNVTKNGKEKRVDIIMKDGTKKSYDLNNAKDKAAFEKKFGPLRNPPPPPSAPVAPPAPGAPVTDQQPV